MKTMEPPGFEEGHQAFNHERDDGPFWPCPVCLRRMSRTQLIELASDLMMTIEDLREKGTAS